LLFGAGEESQRAGSSIEHGVGRSDGAFEHPTLEDCDNASLLDRDRVETMVGILTTAAASTPEATPRLLMSKLGSNAPSALHRLLWQAQKLGTTLETPLADSHTDRWRLPRCSILYKKTEDSISDPPPTDAEPETTTGATDIRDSSKRTADSAGLNEGGEGVHRLEKARRAGQCAGPSRCRRV